ncbi:9594_t:CDS:2 [Funneliformis geosporum]|nr:9594_t:CDS:2 [Funneliformis geosporum]
MCPKPITALAGRSVKVTPRRMRSDSGELLCLLAWYPLQSFKSGALNASEGGTGYVKERSQHKQDLQKFWKGQSKSVKKKINLPSAIPPPINYSDLDKSTTTTKSFTARTPSPVKKLTHQFDDNIKSYPRPTFKSYDKSYDISNEEAVRGALKNNVFDIFISLQLRMQTFSFLKVMSIHHTSCHKYI